MASQRQDVVTNARTNFDMSARQPSEVHASSYCEGLPAKKAKENKGGAWMFGGREPPQKKETHVQHITVNTRHYNVDPSISRGKLQKDVYRVYGLW